MSSETARDRVLEELEFLEGLLFQIAEYKFPDPAIYARIRAELLVVPGLANRLPLFVREFETPEEVWGHVGRLTHETGEGIWAGRRRQIGERMAPVIQWVRDGMVKSVSPSSGFSGRVSAIAVTTNVVIGDRKVVVFGPDDSVGIVRLKQIQDELARAGHPSHLIRELPDVPDQSIEQKARLWSLLGPFAVMEDSVAGGHLVEYEYCKQMGVTLIVLRETGKGSTWMIKATDSLTYPFIRFIEYDPKDLSRAVAEAVRWANELSAKKEREFAKEPWRS